MAACDPAAARGPASFRGASSCGDGIVDAGEACDLGFANRADGPCRACDLPRCGDGVVDPGEACDAGADGDGSCSDVCTLTWPRTWTRVLDTGDDDEPVLDLVRATEGDALHVGSSHADDPAAAGLSVTRRAATGDTRWRWVSSGRGRAEAVAVAADGSIFVAGSLEPARAWLGAFEPDGTLRWARELGTGSAVAVVARDDAGWVAVADGEGGGHVRPFASDGTLAAAVASDLGPRSLAIVGERTLVAGTDAQGRGVVQAVDDATWTAVDLVDFGEVVALASDAGAATVYALATARLDDGDASVVVARLDAGGPPIWTVDLSPPYGRREAGDLAIAGDRLVVVGRDPIPRSICGERLCPARPWIAELDREEGTLRRELLPDDVALGSADAIAVDGEAIYVGGQSRRLFAQPDGWLVRFVPEAGA